ncbi:DUF1254 domain-containing protein [Paraburkholderia sp. UCT2]|uniref:DUF1254 domain-containing protein n=1 Tax=Paraburkholderia sp. UCT2 TaxID=2615208 RepID=UPI00223B960C|nr:DUF1254 domain-containing protein [Paraburkholderia sp. UCT2]
MQAIKGDRAFGKWLHLGASSPADTDIVTPNNDTPYSYAWVDVRSEPWVLSMPRIEKHRYYTSQWDDLWGYVIDNPGSLNDGNSGVLKKNKDGSLTIYVSATAAPQCDCPVWVGKTHSLTVRSAIRRRRFTNGSKPSCSRRTAPYRRTSAKAPNIRRQNHWPFPRLLASRFRFCLTIHHATFQDALTRPYVQDLL